LTLIAGIPGTGIGGLFFVVCALWMPVVEVWKWTAGRGNSGELKLAWRQASIAGSVLLCIAGAGWLLGLGSTVAGGLLAIGGVFGTALLLALVLGGVRTIGLLVGRP
jgi:hypothetical protein